MRIQRTIRKRFVDAACGSGVSRPHVVVSHSMGTVIAYDCLKRVAECVPVDGLITIGSPLGIDEVQDKLQPGWTRATVSLTRRSHSAGSTCSTGSTRSAASIRDLANDFRTGGAETIQDIAVQNEGTWRHSATKYLRQPSFGSALRRMLDA